MTALIKTVAIVGAGTMGHALAQVFAQGGYAVWLVDVSEAVLAKARRLIASNLSTLVETGCFPQEEVPGLRPGRAGWRRARWRRIAATDGCGGHAR